MILIGERKEGEDSEQLITPLLIWVLSTLRETVNVHVNYRSLRTDSHFFDQYNSAFRRELYFIHFLKLVQI